jgi:ATP-dependent Lhr-like helicase
MKQIRAEHAFLTPSGNVLLDDATGYRLWTFAGGRANNLLAKVLEGLLGEKVTASNTALRFKDDAAKSEVAIRQALDQLRAEHRPSEADTLRYGQSCARGRLSKFEPCLPEPLQAKYFASALTDASTAKACLDA